MLVDVLPHRTLVDDFVEPSCASSKPSTRSAMPNMVPNMVPNTVAYIGHTQQALPCLMGYLMAYLCHDNA